MSDGPDAPERRNDGTAPTTPVQFPGALESTDYSVDRFTLCLGAVAGLGAGATNLALTDGPLVPWLVGCLVFGSVAATAVGPHADGPGDGLVRGLGTGVLTWIVVLAALSAVQGTMMTGLPVAFELFVQLTIGVGAPVGLTVGAVGGVGADRERLPRTTATGAVAGVAGGAVFAALAAGNGPFRFLAGLVGAESVVVGLLIHYLVAGTIGALFALLLGHEVRSTGSSLVFGFAYGLFWWLFGWLTLLPLLQSGTVAWTPAAASARLGALVGHGVYGILLGLLYAVLEGVWRGLLYSPDPVHPGTGAVSTRVVESALRGSVAGVVGAAGAVVLVWRTGGLTSIVPLLEPWGVALTLLVSPGLGGLVGAGYGPLFRYEASDLGAGLLWGVVYGTVWWVLGPLTVLPAVQSGSVSWTTEAVVTAVPGLVGCIVYGALTGTVFTLLERRRAAWAAVSPRINERERRHRRPFGTAAPALWLFVLGVTTVVPALLV